MEGTEPQEEGRRRGSIWDRIIMDFAKRGVKPFVALFLIEIALFLVISALPFLPGEQSLYTSQGNQIGNEFQGVGLFGQFVGIFANNFRIALIEMVPIIGPILFAISIYETARVSEALALTQGLPPVLVVIVLLLLFPHSWLELPAYAVATMEGLFLFYALLTSVGGRGKKSDGAVMPAVVGPSRLRREAGQVLLILIIVAVMLAVAALFESVELQLGVGFWITWLPFAGLIALSVYLLRRVSRMKREAEIEEEQQKKTTTTIGTTGVAPV